MADLVCSPNAAVAFDFFTRKGLSDFQAAAIVGNLQQESGINPRNHPASATAEQGFGIAAWHPDRWQNLQAFANGRDIWALDTQLDFLWHELQTVPSNGLSPLVASTTIEDATAAFQDNFERCGNCRPDKRIAYAKSALYACPALKPPPAPSRGGALAAAAAALALTAAAGYSLYRAFTVFPPRPRLQPRPEPEPVSPTHTRPFPGGRPSFDYRGRL